jgi:predicted RNA-binding Zn-ribbon protein involved in translation (DUF1610 family)
MQKRQYGCPQCLNFGKVQLVIVQPDGSRKLSEPMVCPKCNGKGK